jgi:hypothetical protein
MLTGTAAASAALAASVTGPPRVWRLLGRTSRAWWCAAGDEVIVVTPGGAAGLPNGVTVAGAPTAPTGEEVLVGGDGIACGGRRWRVTRWWDPCAPPVAADPVVMAGRVGRVAASLGIATVTPLGTALASGDPGAVVDAIVALAGRGSGLTPEGDDRIAGAVAGYGYAARCTGGPTALLDRVRGPVLDAAAARTTRLSRSLLHHAFAGAVALPAGRLLLALAGRGDPMAALAVTLEIGASSGRALAGGILEGTRAALAVTR